MSLTMLPKTKLLIVDDHQLVLDGIESLLKDQETFEITGNTHDPLTALDLLAKNPTDVLLTDINMPGMSGMELTMEVRKLFPKVRILVLSMFCEGSLIAQMVSAGVSGYILKNTGKAELLEALTKIAGGATYFCPEVTQELTKALKQQHSENTSSLTNREVEIIKLINQEYSNKQIAGKLFISERTVETHRKNIFRKTNTQSVVGLLRHARENHIL